MKALFKYALTLFVFLVSATAGQDQFSRNYDRRIAVIQQQNRKNINNTDFGDGNSYIRGDTIANIKDILEKRLRNEPTPLEQDKSIWAAPYWNYMVFTRFADGVATGQLTCDESGLEALRATLHQEPQYLAFVPQIDNAVDDVIKHCDNLALLALINMLRGAMPAAAPADWQTTNVYPPGDENGYCLGQPRYQCTRYMNLYCAEVLIHPYGNTPDPRHPGKEYGIDFSPTRGHFNAKIPLTEHEQLRQYILANLPQGTRLAPELVITVQNPGLSDDPDEQLFRPQHAFFNHYTGQNVQSNVDCWVKWWDTNGASRTFTFLHNATTPRPVSIHPGRQLGDIDISSETHQLGFYNDKLRTRVVLSSTYFNDGPIGGTIKTALNFIFTPAAWTLWEQLSGQFMPIGDIFRELFWWGHMPIEVMDLLEISTVA